MSTGFALFELGDTHGFHGRSSSIYNSGNSLILALISHPKIARASSLLPIRANYSTRTVTQPPLYRFL